MANVLTQNSKPSRPVSLSALTSDDLPYLNEVLNGRCDQTRLADALRTLLGLYYQPDESEDERVRYVDAFVEVLANMSADCVWWAMREWRRTETRRPTPAALRQLCMMRGQEATRALLRLQPPEPTPEVVPFPLATPEQLEERKATFARVAAECGMVRDRVGQWTFPDEVEPPRVPHWSETAAADDPRWAMLEQARAANWRLMQRRREVGA